MKLTCLLTILFFCGCHNPNADDVRTKKIDKVDSLTTKLQGNWGGLGEDSPVWEIKSDSIYYYQEKKSYPYQIVDKDLVIERPESKGILGNISVIEDTMTFYDEQGLKVSGYRFRGKPFKK